MNFLRFLVKKLNIENKILDNDDGTKDFEEKDINIYYAKKQSRKSRKELGNDYNRVKKAIKRGGHKAWNAK